MKMSDALRGAAESAPVADVHIETTAAARRVQRSRAVRMGANGIVGVGAAALVFAGVMGAVSNQTALTAAEDGGGERNANPQADLGAIEPGLVDGAMLACGYAFDPAAYPGGAVTSVATVGGVDDRTVQLDVTYSNSSETPFTVDVPGVYVIWDGIVVANTGVTTDAVTTTVTAAEPAIVSGSTDLVNCWDGAALPAGDYTFVTVTPVFPVLDEAPPVEEPTAGPEEPTVAPDEPTAAPDEPATEPATEPAPEPSDGDVSVSSDAAATTDNVITQLYAVSDGVTVTIAGDAVENPFDEYLNPEPLPNPDLPGDALTSDAAREAYEAALTGAWDMAPGSQRVVKTGDSKNASEDLWSQAYFGCAMEGTSGRFPGESADLDWLTVDASLPGAIDVSYGWIVNGNPLVGYGVTNSSEWSLPGFYPGGSPHLVLVSEGRVVAEAWPVNPDNNAGGAIAYSGEEDLAAATDSKLIWAPVDDYLAPGEKISGEYLWRDISGCWNGSTQADVAPGTYTVLAVHDMYIGGSYAVLEGDPAASTRDSEIGGGSDAAQVDPQFGIDDYLSFQVWTSLGQVSVTN